MDGHPRFITFEGTDKTGKSTQIPRLNAYLRRRGFETVVTREPGGTPLGERIRDLVLRSAHEIDPVAESLMFVAARAQHVSRVIEPALAAGKVVLCDRYFDSTLAYQGYGDGVDLSWLAHLHQTTTNGLMPGLTLLFVLPEGKMLGPRDSSDRVEGRTEEYRARVRDGFLRLAQQHPERIRTLKGDDSISEVQAGIRVLVRSLLVGSACRGGRYCP